MATEEERGCSGPKGPSPEEFSGRPGERIYVLRVAPRGGEVSVQRRGLDDLGRTFPSLLTAFDHIERELEDGSSLSRPEGLR